LEKTFLKTEIERDNMKEKKGKNAKSIKKAQRKACTGFLRIVAVCAMEGLEGRKIAQKCKIVEIMSKNSGKSCTKLMAKNGKSY